MTPEEWRLRLAAQQKEQRARAKAKDPEKFRRYNRAWKAKNRDKVRAIDRKSLRRVKERRAGTACPPVCECCGNPPPTSKPLFWDHCHKGGHFRGWLCVHCNGALGFALDDTERLQKLIDYLVRDRAKQR